MTEPAWKNEIIGLHDVFETYFLGTTNDLARVEAVLASDFTMVGPDGSTSSRSDTMAAIAAGHDHTNSLTIITRDHRLLIDSADLMVAEYVEEHVLSDRTNQRRATVVFTADSAAPNGLVWRRVHETWVPV